MIFIGQASLRRAVAEYADHSHGERNHQGLDNRLFGTVPSSRPPQASCQHLCIQLGHLLERDISRKKEMPWAKLQTARGLKCIRRT